MELHELLRRRRMTRSFRPDPVPAGTAEALVAAALRAPAAGNAAGWSFVALEGDEAAAYWDTTLPAPGREGFAWPGLLAAPLLLVCLCRPETWVARYGEPDKARTGLGAGEEAWPVPYWWVDTGMATALAQLAAIDAGLGVCFFGLFDHEAAVLERLGVPEGWRAAGTLAVGWPAPEGDRPSRSAQRPRPSVADALHRGRW